MFAGTNKLSTHNWSNKDKGAATVYLTKRTTIKCAANSKTTIYATGSTVRAIYKPQADLTIKTLVAGDTTGSLTILSNHNGIEGKSYQNSSDVMTIEDAQVEIQTVQAALVDFSNITFKGNASTTIIPINSNTTNVHVYQVKSMTFEGEQHIDEPYNGYFESYKKSIVVLSEPITNQTIVINADVIWLNDNDSQIPDANFRKCLKEWLSLYGTVREKGYVERCLARTYDAKLDISHKNIKTLKGIENFPSLTYLNCAVNQLTELDLSENKNLKYLACLKNLIGKDKMQTLVESLPTVTNGEFYVIDMYGINKGNNEKNFITPAQVTKAKNKGWKVFAQQGSGYKEFAGAVAVSVKCQPAEGGTVEGEGIYEADTNVTLTAKPSEGYKFVEWRDFRSNNVLNANVTFTYNVKSPSAGTDTKKAVFEKDGTTEINTIENGQSTVDSWYSIDGKKLSGEPTKKGVYIKNGRKVVK